MAANERRRKNDHNALLGYILVPGHGQIYMVIFLNRWLSLVASDKSIQSHMVSYCSAIKWTSSQQNITILIKNALISTKI